MMIELGVNGEGVKEKDLLTGCSCILAPTGAGKSYAVAVVCEQLASQNLGFCIIDTTGEHFTIKKGYDILWVGGEEADVNVNSLSLKELALRVVKENLPVILDVSGFKKSSELVRDWINELYNAAKTLKNPYLLVIEEADKFIPKKEDKLEVIKEIAKKGKKQGLGLLIASQKPSLINKEVFGQCTHQFIGKLTLEDDINAVRPFFNSRKNLYSLTELLPGEFFMNGFSVKESLFKFKERVTDHKSVTVDISKKLSKKMKDFIRSLNSSRGLGVKAELTEDEAKKLALCNCHKKHLLFGDKEFVQSVELFYKPLIELSLDVPKKRFFRKEYLSVIAYLTNEMKVVNSNFSVMFDLSFLNELSKKQVSVLMSLLYDHSRTIDELVSRTGIIKEDLRANLNRLVEMGFVAHTGWSGVDRVFKVVKDISLPRVTSIVSNKIEPGVIVNQNFTFDEKVIERVVKLLDPEVTILGTKVIYYPFYKAVLKRENASRELFINAVTGRVS
jgi:hypothetical protein